MVRYRVLKVIGIVYRNRCKALEVSHISLVVSLLVTIFSSRDIEISRISEISRMASMTTRK